MAWEPTDSSDKLRDELVAYISFWFKSDGYKNRVPKRHIKCVKQGEKRHAGISIVIVSEPDPTSSWSYRDPDSLRIVMEEYHQVALVIKADDKSGGMASISPIVTILKCLFASREDSLERTDLINRGLFNVFEATEGLEVDPGANDEEGVFFSQKVNLNCSTDMFTQ